MMIQLVVMANKVGTSWEAAALKDSVYEGNCDAATIWNALQNALSKASLIDIPEGTRAVVELKLFKPE